MCIINAQIGPITFENFAIVLIKTFKWEFVHFVPTSDEDEFFTQESLLNSHAKQNNVHFYISSSQHDDWR